MPLDESLHLTTRIETRQAGPERSRRSRRRRSTRRSRDRAPVRELDEAMRAREAQVKVARAERIPSLAIVSSYQRLYFPANSSSRRSNHGVNNWTVGLSTSFPILDGGRIKGDQTIARGRRGAGARAARADARVRGARHARRAQRSSRKREAAWDASRGTAEQAQRAYAIDEVRFREGISTQTDLTQSRLLARAGAGEPRDGGAQPRRRARSARAAPRPADPADRNRRGVGAERGSAAATTTAAAITTTNELVNSGAHTSRRRWNDRGHSAMNRWQ